MFPYCPLIFCVFFDLFYWGFKKVSLLFCVWKIIFMIDFTIALHHTFSWFLICIWILVKWELSIMRLTVSSWEWVPYIVLFIDILYILIDGLCIPGSFRFEYIKIRHISLPVWVVFGEYAIEHNFQGLIFPCRVTFF